MSDDLHFLTFEPEIVFGAEKKFLRLADIECYVISFGLSNRVWEVVAQWNGLAQRTVGEQYIRAIDSVSANIAEGFGRYVKKNIIRFYRIARASLFECLDWNEKAKARNLLSLEQYKSLFSDLQRLPKSINGLIKFTNEKLQT